MLSRVLSPLGAGDIMLHCFSSWAGILWPYFFHDYHTSPSNSDTYPRNDLNQHFAWLLIYVNLEK